MESDNWHEATSIRLLPAGELYLNPLDHHMACAGFEMTRYVDDFVIQCRTEEDTHRALAEVHRGCVPAGLTVHASKTCVVCVVCEIQRRRVNLDCPSGRHWVGSAGCDVP